MTDDLKNAETSLVWALDKASTSLEVRNAVNKALGYVRQAQAPAQDEMTHSSAPKWTIADGKRITGETVIFDGTFIVAIVTRREDAERIVGAVSAPRTPAGCEDEDRMVKISKLLADLERIKEQFGDTCVYVRRGGLSWGAVALNNRDDDQKHGVFDLQAQHDRNMLQRAEQVERLIKARNEAEQKLAQARTQVEDAAKQFKLIEYSLTKDSLCDAERIDSALHVARRARSAPAFKAPRNTAERSPSSDAAGAGADTSSLTSTGRQDV